MKFYILDENKIPKVVTNAKWFEIAKRIVARDTIGNSLVSTVFIGIDHNLSLEGPPVRFETMVFGGPLDDRTERYCTWAEAVAGHKRIVKQVEDKNK